MEARFLASCWNHGDYRYTFALLYIVLILRVFIMQICKIIFDKEKLSQNWINFVRNSCFPIIRAVGYKYELPQSCVWRLIDNGKWYISSYTEIIIRVYRVMVTLTLK